MKLLKLAQSVSHIQLGSDLFSILDVLHDGKTITTKENTLLQVIKLQGFDYTGMDHEDRIQIWRNRLSFINAITEEYQISLHYMRKRSDVQEPEWQIDNKYAKHIVNERAKNIRKAYKTEIYMVVSNNSSKNLFNKIPSKNYNAEIARREGRREELESFVSTICALLKVHFKPTILSVEDEDQELFKFWSFLINGSFPKTVPNNPFNLNASLPVSVIGFSDSKNKAWLQKMERSLKEHVKDEGFVESYLSEISSHLSSFNKPYVIFNNEENLRYASILFIKDYPSELQEGAIDDITSIDHDFNVVQHFRPVDDIKFKNDLQMRLRLLKGVSAFNRVAVAEIIDILEGMEGDKIKQIFEHSYQIIVYGDTPQEVEEGIAKLTSLFAKKGITFGREKINTEPAFWSMFPDLEFAYSARKINVTNFALNNFCTFGSKSQGHEKCSFGNAPVAYFNTASNENYGFIFHESPKPFTNGNTLIIGKPGSGKSVLKSLLIANLLKYNGGKNQDPFKMMVFDNLRGLNVPIEAFGGQYINFSDGYNLAPLQLDDTPTNRRFLKEWLSMLIDAQGQADEEVIENIIQANYHDIKNKEERSLYECRGQMGQGEYFSRFRNWLPAYNDKKDNEGRPNAFLFNGEKDPFSFENRIIGFNMTDIFNSEELIGPVSSYIFHSWKNYIETHNLPSAVIIDEAVNFLRDPYFYQFIDLGLREFRKKNGIMIFSIQDLGSMYSIEKAAEFLGYIETFIIFPNPTAEESDYIGKSESDKRGIGLTKEEFKWIKQGSSGQFEFMVKRKSGSSVILKNDLGFLNEHLNLLRGDKSVLEAYDRLSSLDEKTLNTRGFNSWQDALLAENF